MTSQTHIPVRDPGRATKRFTWNRTHTVFMVGLLAFCAIAGAMAAFNLTAASVRTAVSLTAPMFPDAVMVALGVGAVGLSVADLIGGCQRTGSLSMPAAGAGAMTVILLGIETVHDVLGTDAATVLANVTITASWFAITAFVPFLIARYGLRPLFSDPDPATRSGRLMLLLRRSPAWTGCWIALIAVYGLYVLVRTIDSYGFATGLMLMVAVPIAMTAICGIAGATDGRAWRLWIAGAALQSALTVLLTNLYVSECPVTDTCLALPNGWHFVLGIQSDVMLLYVVGPAAIWLAALGIGTLIRKRQQSA